MNKTRKIRIVVVLALLFLMTPVAILLWAPMAYSGLLGWVVRDSTGLDLAVEDLEVSLFPTRVAGSNLRLTNPHIEFDDPLVTARQFTIVADLSGWWTNAPTWWRADATGMLVRAARNKSGTGNWDLPARGTRKGSSADSGTSPLYRFSSIGIEELEFRRIQPEQTHVFTVRQLSLSRASDERLSVELDASYQGEAVTASGTLALPTSEQARDVDFVARFPGGSIEVSGRVGHDGIVPGEAAFSLDAGNLSVIGRLLDQDLSAFDPLAIDGRLEAPKPDRWVLSAEGRLAEQPLELSLNMETPDQQYIVEAFRLKLGPDALHGHAHVDLAERMAKVQIEADAVDVDRLAGLAGADEGGSAGGAPLASLDGWNVEIGASAQELVFRGYQVHGLESRAVLDSGLLRGTLTLNSARIRARAEEGADSPEGGAIALTQPLQIEAKLKLDFDDADGHAGVRAIDATVSTTGLEASLDANLSPDAYLFESGELQARIEDLSAIEGLDLPTVWSRTLLPLDISLTGRPGPSAWQLEPIRLDTPDTVITGSLTIDRSRRPPHFSGRLHADQLDINRLRTTAGMQDPQDGVTGGDEAGNDGDVFSETPLEWRWLEVMTLDLDITLDRLTVNQTMFKDVALRAALSDARLDVDPLTADLSEGGVRGHATLTGGGGTPEAAVELVVTKLAPADLGVKDAGLIDGGYTDLLVNLESRGRSPQALASHLEGELAFEVQRAIIRNDLFNLIGSDLFTQFISLINPFVKQNNRTSLECAAAYFEVREGVLSSTDRIVIETEKMKVRGSALIDLETESVRIDFRPSARQGLGVGLGDISGVVRIGGTLGDPNVETSASGVGKAGATIGAAFATGGLSLLAQGIFDRLRNAGGTACGRIFERATDTVIPEAIRTEELEPQPDTG